jgi:hypothetical protein
MPLNVAVAATAAVHAHAACTHVRTRVVHMLCGVLLLILLICGVDLEWACWPLVSLLALPLQVYSKPGKALYAFETRWSSAASSFRSRSLQWVKG